MTVQGKTGLFAGIGIGAGGILVLLVIIGSTLPVETGDSEQGNLIPENTETHFENSGLNRAEIEQMALTNPLINGLVDGDIMIYFEPLPSYASYAVRNEIQEIKNNFNVYEPSLQIQFEITNNPNVADIHISWIKNYGTHTVGEAIFKSVVKIGLGKETCLGDWQPFDSETVRNIIVHEIGHSLGFGHSNDRENIMYYQTQTKFEKDFDKSITLDEGQAYTIPFCSSGQYHYSLESNNESNGFFVYITTPETNTQSFLEGISGRHYSNCSGDDPYYQFSNSCDVPQGATMVIWNKNDLLQFSAINIHVTITEQNIRPMPNYEWDENAFEYDEEFLNQIISMYS